MGVGNRCRLQLLSIAALAAAMTIGLGGASVAQDATPTAMAGDDAGVAYLSHLHSGSCDDLSAEPVERLADLLLPEWVAGLTGGDTAIAAEDFGNAPIPVAVATTEVAVPLADIVAGGHAINIEQPNPDDPENSVACGNIGGVIDENGDLFVGLGGEDASAHSGVIWLHDNGASTTIVVFLAHPDEAAGIATALDELAAQAAATPGATPVATPVAGDGAEATPVT
jgi:hypothetical protein